MGTADAEFRTANVEFGTARMEFEAADSEFGIRLTPLSPLHHCDGEGKRVVSRYLAAITPGSINPRPWLGHINEMTMMEIPVVTITE
ncbi:MAG: hypothetical protein ACM3YE_09475 [Bacteroidota bacterium]